MFISSEMCEKLHWGAINSYTITCVCLSWQWLLMAYRLPYHCFSCGQLMWVKTLKSNRWRCIPLKHTCNNSHYPDRVQQRCSLHAPFQKKKASHFQHDESAVIHAANGLSSHCLINKHWDPGEHPWILITLWPWQRTRPQEQDRTDRHSVPFLIFPTNNCQKKQNARQTRFAGRSLLIPHFIKLLSTSEGNLVVIPLGRMLRL